MDKRTQKLLKQLDNPQAKKRYEAVLELGLTGDLSLSATLEKVATLDEHPKVRHLAGQAVQTFDLLAQRQRAQAMAAEEPDDFSGAWDGLASANMMQGRAERQIGDEGWSYEDSKRKEEEEAQERARQKEEEAKLAAKRAKRRRAPFRIALILSTMLACLLGVLGIWYALEVERPPTSPDESRAALAKWSAAQAEALSAYQAAFGQDPIACPPLTDLARPTPPRWVVLRDPNAPQRPDWQGIADELSRIEDSALLGLEDILNALQEVDAYLLIIDGVSDKACQGQESLAPAVWTDFTLAVSSANEAQILLDGVRLILNMPTPAP